VQAACGLPDQAFHPSSNLIKERQMNRREIFAAAGLGTGAALLASTGALAQSAPAAAPAAAAGSRLARILESGKLRVGTTGDFNPMSFKDLASNSYQGYDIDATTRLAADLQVKVEFVASEWATITAGIAADRFDLFSGASLSVPRARVAAFTVPINEVGTVPLSLAAKAAKYNSWDAINTEGTRVAILMGTTFDEQARRHFPKATIQAVQAPATGWQEVLAGRADVTITSNIEASTLVKRYPDLAITVGVDQMRSKAPRGYVVAQDDLVWLNFLNTWITLRTIEGYYKELDAKWLGA
jgi:cyclohexadienyl dehydratase